MRIEDELDGYPIRRVAFAIGTISVLPFLYALLCGFVFDDASAVMESPVVTGNFDLGQMFSTGFWGRGAENTTGSYRPFAVLTLFMDYHLGGGHPWSFHVTNLVFHALASGLLFVVLAARFPRKVAAVAALIFGLHALHTENVVGIVARADVLATIFSLLALHTARSPRVKIAALAGPLLFLGLMSKEISVAVLAIAVAEDVLGLDPSRQCSRKSRAVALAGLWLALVAYLLLRIFALEKLSAPVSLVGNPLLEASFGARLLTAPMLLWKALGLMLLPASLSADYSFPQIMPVTSIGHFDVVAGLLMWVAIPACMLLLRKRRPAIAFGAALFLAAYVPVSNTLVLIPTIFAERLLYLPSAGFALMLAAALVPLLDRVRYRKLAVAALAAVCLFNVVRAGLRTRDWESQRTLFEAATVSTPYSSRAWTNLGITAMLVKDWQEAAESFTVAVTLGPRFVTARSYLGITLDMLDKPQQAFENFFAAVRLAPTCDKCIHNLVGFYAKYGRFDEAMAEIRIFRAHGGKETLAVELETRVKNVRARADKEQLLSPK